MIQPTEMVHRALRSSAGFGTTDDEYHMSSKERTFVVIYAPSNDYSTENATVKRQGPQCRWRRAVEWFRADGPLRAVAGRDKSKITRW